MKYFLIGAIVIVVALAGFWAGKKSGDDEPETTVTQTPLRPSDSAGLAPTATSTSNTTSALIGNRPGDKAPDFRLKDSQGHDVSLRDYQGREGIRLIFTVSGQLVLQPDSAGQGITLYDPGDAVHRLYAVAAMPYTVIIDVNGIIR